MKNDSIDVQFLRDSVCVAYAYKSRLMGYRPISQLRFEKGDIHRFRLFDGQKVWSLARKRHLGHRQTIKLLLPDNSINPCYVEVPGRAFRLLFERGRITTGDIAFEWFEQRPELDTKWSGIPITNFKSFKDMIDRTPHYPLSFLLRNRQ